MHLFLVVLLFLPCLAFANVVGVPTIECTAEGITVNILLENDFKGALFLRGSAEKKSCKADFSQEPSSNITYTFPFHSCPSRKKRQIQPPKGMIMSSILVVSFHGTIITHKDIAYQVECFYKEQHSKVHATLNVTAPLPTVLSDSAQPQLPVCDYKVESANNMSSAVATSTIVSSGVAPVVSVGDNVIHVWTCSNSPRNIYCMQVHSCMADDGNEDSIQVVDERGCTMDGDLLSPIHYNGGNRAAASSQAFMFADQHSVYFKCSIRLTLKSPGSECPAIDCSDTRRRRHLHIFDSIFSKYTEVFEISAAAPEIIVREGSTSNFISSDAYSRKDYLVYNTSGRMIVPSLLLFFVLLL